MADSSSCQLEHSWEQKDTNHPTEMDDQRRLTNWHSSPNPTRKVSPQITWEMFIQQLIYFVQE
jgi:hypothetical protein